MTESAFPFGAATDDESEAPTPAEHSDETRTNILIGAGGALAAIAMAAGFLVFAGGDDSDEQFLAAAPPAPGSAAPAAPKPTTPSTAAPRVEPPPVAAPVGRDPFAPLYRPPVPVAAAAVPVGTVVAPIGGTGGTGGIVAPIGGTGTTGIGTAPVAPQGPQAPAQPVQPAQPAARPQAQQPAPTDPQPVSHQLRMVRVYQANGVWFTELTLDGRVYRPAVGETFAESFQLVSTQDSCGSYLFGDERFDLCVGEITVRQK